MSLSRRIQMLLSTDCALHMDRNERDTVSLQFFGQWTRLNLNTPYFGIDLVKEDADWKEVGRETRVQRLPVHSLPRRALSTWRTHCSPECDSDIECQRGGRSSHLAHLCPFTASPHANMSNRSLDVSLATSHLGSLIRRSLGKIMKSQRFEHVWHLNVRVSRTELLPSSPCAHSQGCWKNCWTSGLVCSNRWWRQFCNTRSESTTSQRTRPQCRRMVAPRCRWRLPCVSLELEKPDLESIWTSCMMHDVRGHRNFQTQNETRNRFLPTAPNGKPSYYLESKWRLRKRLKRCLGVIWTGFTQAARRVDWSLKRWLARFQSRSQDGPCAAIKTLTQSACKCTPAHQSESHLMFSQVLLCHGHVLRSVDVQNASVRVTVPTGF